MYNPFRQSCTQQPFLSPLGKHQRSLPSVAAPLAVIVIGGIALVAASSVLFSGFAIKPDIADTVTAATQASQDQTTSDQKLTRTDHPDQAEILPVVAIAPVPETQALSFNAPATTNEAEIAVLEVIQMPPVEDEPDLIVATEAEIPAAPQAVAQMPAAPKPSSGPGNALTNGAVNMRASPDKNAPVLLVVPANAAIEAQTNCSWCAITYQGNQGYIYKSFINYR